MNRNHRFVFIHPDDREFPVWCTRKNVLKGLESLAGLVERPAGSFVVEADTDVVRSLPDFDTGWTARSNRGNLYTVSGIDDSPYSESATDITLAAIGGGAVR